MEIRHINDVLPLIEGRKEFVVKRDPNYIAIDYQVAFFDTFDDPRRIELRGIKFAADGTILARPLHKFFNLGEREDTQPYAIDFDAPHVIMDKLDGSMVHPAMIDNDVRFMTRMGLTPVAERAERHLSDGMALAIADMLAAGQTPIFEFTAPDNRIVIKYAESALTLLAIRETISGRYLPQEEIERVARRWQIPFVRVWEKPQSITDFIATVRALKGAEGVVIRFDHGPWIKLKGEEYALMHKAKDSITREKNVLACVLDGVADDIRPLLLEEDRTMFDRYADRLGCRMKALAEQIEEAVANGAHLDQKAFAVDHLGDAPAWLRSMAFPVRKGLVTPLEAVRTYLRKHCGSQSDVDEIRPLLGFDWDGPTITE